MGTVTMSELISQVKQEANSQKQQNEPKNTRDFNSVLNIMTGEGAGVEKVASDATSVAVELETKLGETELTLSETLEKIAEEMEDAQTLDDITKIASQVGGSDFAFLDKIASKISDLVVADLEARLTEEG